MNVMFLELDVADPIDPFNGFDIESPKAVSLPLLILGVGVSNVIPVETVVRLKI